MPPDLADMAEAAPAAAGRPGVPDDLAQVIRAYTQVTENLLHSYESLQGEVGRLQEQLASTDAQLQRSKRLAALGEMAAGIAHEIRNPLGAIRLYADMIAEDLGPLAEAADGTPPDDVDAGAPGPVGRSAEAAGKIVAAVRGLDAIVNDVLSFSRDLHPQRRALPVDSLFHRLLQAEGAALDAAGITVRCPRLEAGGDDLMIDADADLLHQAMLNLVRNAIDAMESGGTLRLDAEPAGRRVQVQVADTGPGIPDEAIDRIFNPFFTTRSTGTGLGLAIVHRIVDAHGGTIAVHNDATGGGGAVFTLDLPAAETMAGGDDDADQPGVSMAYAGAEA
jgi:signal transduction histidine kinase